MQAGLGGTLLGRQLPWGQRRSQGFRRRFSNVAGKAGPICLALAAAATVVGQAFVASKVERFSRFQGRQGRGCASHLPRAAQDDFLDLGDELAAMAAAKSRRGIPPSPPPSPARAPAPAPAPGPAPSAKVSAPAAQAAGSLYKPGKALEGIVRNVKDSGLVVQIAKSKQTGFVHVSELKEGYVRHPAELHELGDKVKVTVLKHDPGFLSLTLKQMGTKDLMADFITGQKVEGVVKVVVEHGAYVNIGATRDAYLFRGNIKDPGDGGNLIRDAREYLQVGDKINAWVRSKDESTGQLQLSMISAQQVLTPIQTGLKIADLRIGQEMGGKVTGVRDFGCFVKVGAEADGLLHVRNINNGLVNDLRTVVKVGDPLVVKVKAINAGKLELELVGSPAGLPAVDSFLKMDKGEWLDGYVSGQAPIGFFVDVDAPDGNIVTGILGARELAVERATVQVGDEVKVRVHEVKAEKRQLFLTQLETAMPDDVVPIQTGLKIASLKVGQEMGGVITGARDFGCFVSVGAEADGLLHVRNINNGIVNDIRAMMKKGDRLNVKVKAVNAGKLELDLIGAPPRLPAVDSFLKVDKDEWLEGQISGQAPFGYFVDIKAPDGQAVIGLLGRREVADKKSRMQVGDEVKARIVEVNVDKKQVFLSQLEAIAKPDV